MAIVHDVFCACTHTHLGIPYFAYTTNPEMVEEITALKGDPTEYMRRHELTDSDITYRYGTTDLSRITLVNQAFSPYSAKPGDVVVLAPLAWRPGILPYVRMIVEGCEGMRVLHTPLPKGLTLGATSPMLGVLNSTDSLTD